MKVYVGTFRRVRTRAFSNARQKSSKINDDRHHNCNDNNNNGNNIS